MSFGLFVNGLVSQLFKFNLMKKSSLFIRKYLQVAVNLGTLLLGITVLHHLEKIPSSIVIAIAVGAGGTMVLYPLIYKLLSIHSGIIKYVAGIVEIVF